MKEKVKMNFYFKFSTKKRNLSAKTFSVSYFLNSSGKMLSLGRLTFPGTKKKLPFYSAISANSIRLWIVKVSMSCSCWIIYSENLMSLL